MILLLRCNVDRDCLSRPDVESTGTGSYDGDSLGLSGEGAVLVFDGAHALC